MPTPRPADRVAARSPPRPAASSATVVATSTRLRLPSFAITRDRRRLETVVAGPVAVSGVRGVPSSAQVRHAPRMASRDRIPALTGVVLAGGRSTRFGRDKAAFEFEGARLVDRVGGVLATVCEEVIVASGDGRRLDGLAWRQVEDAVADAGPIAGIVNRPGDLAGPGGADGGAGGA